MTSAAQTERRLAATTSWGLLGSFGCALIFSGFAQAHISMGLCGFLLLVVGFVSHVIINYVFHLGFTRGEIALGLFVFGISLLGFVASWIFDPLFGTESIVIGLVGFTAMLACLVLYVLITYGVRGSITMIESLHNR